MLTCRFFRPFALLSSIALPSVATAQTALTQCWRADELDAVRVHDFKVRLLTGALHCRDRVPTMLDSYNDFIESKRDYLVASQYVVRAAFIRGGGVAQGGGAYTSYETSVGNKYASHAYSKARCEMLGAFARWGADAGEEDLPHLISGMAGAVEPRLCPAPVIVAVRARPAPAFAAPRPFPPVGADPTARTAALIARVRNERSRPAFMPVVRPAATLVAAAPAVRPPAASPADAPEPINDGPPEVPVVAEAVPASVVAKPVRTRIAAKSPPALVAEKPAAAAAKPAMSVDAAQALAEAAKSLAAAAAAMQAQGATRAE